MSDKEEHGEFCTITYAAQRTGLAAKTWYRGGAGTDGVRRVKLGRSVRLLRADVDRFINELVDKATKQARREP